MGWWRISSVESGGIDWSRCKPGTGLANAIPGEDAAGVLYNGDGPADIMGVALKEVNDEYVRAWGREASEDELRAVFNFCLGGMLAGRRIEERSQPDER